MGLAELITDLVVAILIAIVGYFVIYNVGMSLVQLEPAMKDIVSKLLALFIFAVTAIIMRVARGGS